MEGILHHLWNVNLFHKMVNDFAELLEVDFGIEQAKFQGYARVKVALYMGKSLLDVRYFAFARNVYPIRFCRSWDICSFSSSSWGPNPPSFSMGSASEREPEILWSTL